MHITRYVYWIVQFPIQLIVDCKEVLYFDNIPLNGRYHVLMHCPNIAKRNSRLLIINYLWHEHISKLICNSLQNILHSQNFSGLNFLKQLKLKIIIPLSLALFTLFNYYLIAHVVCALCKMTESILKHNISLQLVTSSLYIKKFQIWKFCKFTFLWTCA